MHGWEGVTAVYYLPGPRPALVETGPASTLDRVLAGLEEAGVRDLDWVVLTHVHLDHAGAVGHMAERFPRARIVVRVEGAPHLVDPRRLWASAARLYGDMEGLWGRMLPVPEDRVVAVSSDGPVADLGDGRTLEAVYAPGHAGHHMAILLKERGDLFAGDALGVYLPDAGVIWPATPPPEFHLDLALESIDRLRATGPRRVFPTHFGPVPEPGAAFEEAASRLRGWVALAEEVSGSGGGVAEVAEAFRRQAGLDFPDLGPRLFAKFEQATSCELNAAGIVRYLTKHRAAAG